MSISSKPPILFSVDLEEFYPADPRRDPRSTPLSDLVDGYLDLLRRVGLRCTFFVVGDVARKYPEVVARIAADGHEVGCHGDKHLTLERFTTDSLVADLRANRYAVESATGTSVAGFRAPLLSLTQKAAWVHEVLHSEGFAYSSSVLPAPNPLYGWPDFGAAPRVRAGVLELPVTLTSVFGTGMIPLFSGTYFRVMPWVVVRRQIERLPVDRPVVCYFHPYDIDHRQPWTMHAGVRGSRAMNALLFVRRRSLLRRLALLLDELPNGMTYRDCAARMTAWLR